MLLKLYAGIGNDTMLPLWVDLGEDGAQAPWLFIVTEAGIDD